LLRKQGDLFRNAAEGLGGRGGNGRSIDIISKGSLYLNPHNYCLSTTRTSMIDWNRRTFVKTSAFSALYLALPPVLPHSRRSSDGKEEPRFQISLAQWSLHRTIRSGALDHLEFAQKAAEDFGIHAIEYVNQFFPDKATNDAYLKEMNQRAADHDVRQLLIMIDGEGGLAEIDDRVRKTSVENHYKWVDAAKTLGCHSIRVNAYSSSDDRMAAHTAAVDGLSTLASYAAPAGLNVIVENHGGFSSDGQWLSSIMKEINMPNCGTLPDFGNFCLQYGDQGCLEAYDRYKGVDELMPYAKAVSAKSHDFDAQGMETHTDYKRMFKIIRKSAYKGYIGIEYEGGQLSEDEGIRRTKALIERMIS
jgi:sugar phosphate isomerase/epimerase